MLGRVICALVVLAAIPHASERTYASESDERLEFLSAAGERIIEESCRPENIYSQCVGQSGDKCEQDMRSGLDHCIEQYINSVPDLNKDPKELEAQFHTLGENLGLCLAELHFELIGIDKNTVYTCWDRK